MHRKKDVMLETCFSFFKTNPQKIDTFRFAQLHCTRMQHLHIWNRTLVKNESSNAHTLLLRLLLLLLFSISHTTVIPATALFYYIGATRNPLD